MTTDTPPANTASGTATGRPTSNGRRTFGIIMITIVLTLGAGYWAVTSWLFPSGFRPVVLSTQQQQRLEQKIRRLGGGSQAGTAQPPLEAEPYSEAGASREIEFSERELNALLANNTELASRLAIDLSEDLISARLLVNVDPDFPLLGGKTIKVTGGMELRLVEGRPGAVFRGISVWGVPLPNAWLGNLKNIDLIHEFGETGGFWQAINDGVEQIEIEEGRLRITLKE